MPLFRGPADDDTVALLMLFIDYATFEWRVTARICSLVYRFIFSTSRRVFILAFDFARLLI